MASPSPRITCTTSSDRISCTWVYSKNAIHISVYHTTTIILFSLILSHSLHEMMVVSQAASANVAHAILASNRSPHISSTKIA